MKRNKEGSVGAGKQVDIRKHISGCCGGSVVCTVVILPIYFFLRLSIGLFTSFLAAACVLMSVFPIPSIAIQKCVVH